MLKVSRVKSRPDGAKVITSGNLRDFPPIVIGTGVNRGALKVEVNPGSATMTLFDLLNESESERFIAALDAPPRKIPAIEALAERYAQETAPAQRFVTDDSD